MLSKNINEGIFVISLQRSWFFQDCVNLTMNFVQKTMIIRCFKYFSKNFTCHTLEFLRLENLYIQKNQNNPKILETFAVIKHKYILRSQKTYCTEFLLN